jgi:hypothetical protein
VRNAGGHPYHRSRRRPDRGAADREGERSLEYQHERVERRRVLGEPLSRVEREQRDAAAGGLRQDTTRNSLLGRGDERL